MKRIARFEKVSLEQFREGMDRMHVRGRQTRTGLREIYEADQAPEARHGRQRGI